MTQWGIDALFNPSKRHMDEEKRRLLATRQQIGDSSGGRRIDLDSGKVTIRRGGDHRIEVLVAAEEAAASAAERSTGDVAPAARDDDASDRSDTHDSD
ncbi:MAG: DUF6191 domain-containing protein [Actinomycetia bacterium]|nr:DUF6191 domain-containing protein [Actinomycetes bacterium]